MAYPYSEKWARDTFMSFWGVRTRTGNMLRILAQYACEADHPATSDDIMAGLIFCVQRKAKQRVWEDFKKLVKRPSTYKEDRARRLAVRIVEELNGCVVESRNLTLDF